MARLTIKLDIKLARGMGNEDWQAIVREQIEEVIPETVYYVTDDDVEHELAVEIVG